MRQARALSRFRWRSFDSLATAIRGEVDGEPSRNMLHAACRMLHLVCCICMSPVACLMRMLHVLGCMLHAACCSRVASSFLRDISAFSSWNLANSVSSSRFRCSARSRARPSRIAARCGRAVWHEPLWTNAGRANVGSGCLCGERRSDPRHVAILQCGSAAVRQCGNGARLQCHSVAGLQRRNAAVRQWCDALMLCVACAASVDASVWFFAMLRTSAAVRFEPMN